MADFPTTFDQNAKLWKGMEKPKVCNETVSAGEAALALLRSRQPQDIMQISVSEKRTMSCGTVLSASIKLAQYFSHIGLTADDVVGIFSPDTTYVLPVALAAWYNATPFQAINWKLERDVVANLYVYSRPKIIFCDGLQYEKVSSASADFKPLIYTLCNHVENEPSIENLLTTVTVDELRFQAKPLTYGSGQTMAILTSSGTSGAPKGACVSNSMCVSDFSFTNASMKIFSAGGIDWSSGLLTFICNVLVGGTRVITSDPLTPKYLLEIINEYEINFLATVSWILLEASRLEEYNKENMKSLQIVFAAGAFCSDNNLDYMRSVLTQGLLFYGYGLTETCGISGRFNGNKPNSVGRLLPNVQLKIVDTQTGYRLGSGEVGEVCVKQSSASHIYYKNPKATAEILDREGFIHTGDLGYMDEDNFLFLVGRKKDTVKYMGYHYSPADIEQIIAELPDVVHVCVFSVFDETKGDIPAAAVVKRDLSVLTAQDVMKYLVGRSTAPYRERLYGVYFVQQLPTNLNGKFLREKVKNMCLNKGN